MARKRVEDTVPALESWDDVNQALATIADNQRTVENFEAAMQNKIDEAKAEAEARGANSSAAQQTLYDLVSKRDSGYAKSSNCLLYTSPSPRDA